MTSKADFRSWLHTEGQAHVAPQGPRHKHPKGMTPGLKLNPQTGEGEAIVAIPAGQEPEWEELLRKFGFGDVIELLDVTEVRAWETFSKEAHDTGTISEAGKPIYEPGVVQLQYVKARVRRKMALGECKDIDALCDEVRNYKPPKPPKPKKSRKQLVKTLMVNFADWQLGKYDGGGTEGIVKRILASIDAVGRRTAELREAGHNVGRLLLAGVGDIIENCDGHYPMQQFMTELHQRDQRKLARRLKVAALQRWAPLFPHIHVLAVPGNHGENRRDGKAFTSFGDNDDVAIYEQIADAFKLNKKAFGHISFQIPDDELTATYDCDGAVIGLAHGHQAGRHSRGDPPSRVKSWWDDCAANRHPIGEADILVSAHYHHLRVLDCGAGRTWFQCPTLDGGSKWFWEKAGCGATVQGTLTFLIDPEHPRKWSNMEVL